MNAYEANENSLLSNDKVAGGHPAVDMGVAIRRRNRCSRGRVFRSRAFRPTAALGRSPVLGVRSIVRRRAITLPVCARPDQLLLKQARARSRSS
jgi:hypothetical protein